MAKVSLVMTEAEKIESATTLMQAIICALVDDPESVSIVAMQAHEATCLQIQVGSSEAGKLIGKQGRTARSLRIVLSAAAMKLDHRFQLKIVESMPGDYV